MGPIKSTGFLYIYLHSPAANHKKKLNHPWTGKYTKSPPGVILDQSFLVPGATEKSFDSADLLAAGNYDFEPLILNSKDQGLPHLKQP